MYIFLIADYLNQFVACLLLFESAGLGYNIIFKVFSMEV